MARRWKLRRLEPPRARDVPPTVEGFLRALGGPALIRIPGRDAGHTRAVATLLHGNEPSGIRALHAWLRAGADPAVNVIAFVGAVPAALEPPGFAHRALPGTPDLNRCFASPVGGEQGELAREAVDELVASQPECLIDLHNNTGHSPAYGVGPELAPANLELVSLFAERFVHSQLRLGALVEATCHLFPSVTIECGRAGDPAADAVARAGLERYMRLERLEAKGGTDSMDILVDPVRVRVRDGARLAFGDRPAAGADLTVSGDIDRHNFEKLQPGVRIGWIGSPDGWPVEAFGADGRDVSRDFFSVRDGVLQTRLGVIPIMMTVHPQIAASDCLFYMVRLHGEPPPSGPAKSR